MFSSTSLSHHNEAFTDTPQVKKAVQKMEPFRELGTQCEGRPTFRAERARFGQLLYPVIDKPHN